MENDKTLEYNIKPTIENTPLELILGIQGEKDLVVSNIIIDTKYECKCEINICNCKYEDSINY